MNSGLNWLIIFALLSCLVNSAEAESLLFDARVEYVIGDDLTPEWAETVDLNADGNKDLVVLDDEGEISVFLGDEDGVFQDVDFRSMGFESTCAEMGDLNGDGCQDILGVRDSDHKLALLFGYGDGTFQDAVYVFVGYSPMDAVLADFDNDSDLDIAVTRMGNKSIQIMLGDGDGTYTPGVSMAVERVPLQIEAEDLNNDGNSDLLVTLNGFYIDTWVGQGNGSFSHKYGFEVSYTGFIIAGDLNNDGYPDLVTKGLTGVGDPGIWLHRGMGDGTFNEYWQFLDFDATYGSVLPTDLDGNGNIDLVVSCDNDEHNGVIVFWGMGNGQFTTSEVYPAGCRPIIYTVDRINGDEHPDLVINSALNNGCLSILFGRDAFSFPTNCDVSVGDMPVSVSIGDLNDDGNMDLITANAAADNVSVLLGNGEGTFQNFASIPVGNEPRSGVLVDLDNDGAVDVVTANGNSDDISVLMGNGNGTFQEALFYGVGDSPYAVAAGDLNGDDDPDLVVTNVDSDTISILIGNGDGTFMPASSYQAGDWPCSVVCGDLNDDGNLDLAVTNRNSDELSIFFGTGDGALLTDGNYPIEHCYSVAAGDLDRDGDLDLVVTSGSWWNTNVSVLLGIGDGTFEEEVSYRNCGASNSVEFCDLNRDGNLDLVTANISRNISVFIGTGNGAFQPAMHYGVSACSRASAVAAGDLDNDNFEDLVVVNGEIDTISILINTSVDLETISAEMTCIPDWGILPFPSLFQASMTNLYEGQARRFQFIIDVTLAGGQYYSNWRRGWQNIMAGETHTKQWSQTIPDLPGLEGVNHFEMTVADITPPPYNLPPYPPAGDTDTDSCGVTGVAP